MSAEATGWVWRHSHYRGAPLLVHLAIADSVNDQHGNELWMSLTNLARKARVSRSTAVEAVAGLVAAGYLEVLEDHRTDRAGKPTRYLFLYPDASAVWDSRRRRPQPDRPAVTPPEQVTADRSPPRGHRSPGDRADDTRVTADRARTQETTQEAEAESPSDLAQPIPLEHRAAAPAGLAAARHAMTAAALERAAGIHQPDASTG